MDQAPGMEEGQAGGRLTYDAKPFGQGAEASALDEDLEVGAEKELHDQVQAIALLAEVEDPRDARVFEMRHREGFAPEPLGQLFVARQLSGQELAKDSARNSLSL